MPLVSIERIGEYTQLGFWSIDESFDEFLNADVTLLAACDGLRSEKRGKEVMAVRLLLREMLGVDVGLCHDAEGRPYLLNGMNIGISHTDGLAAVIVSKNSKVAVDVEYLSGRVGRIRDKFMRHDEQADDMQALLLHWCAKETLYKLCSELHPGLKDMRIFDVAEPLGFEGKIKAGIVPANVIVDVFYRITSKYVIAYSVL